jgi:hypothetical protein
MSDIKIYTPILFLIFNRPDTTQQVFNEIRKAQPAQLFVAADGPRKNQVADYELCKETREIIRQVDWDCRVFTRFQDENLGCRHAVSSAITWFFSNVEEGIILEDDCIPDQSFFRFCQELLEKYRDDERIMMVSGNNFQFGKRRTNYSYYFSKYFHIWGWATWRRAWNHYDVEMKSWPLIRDGRWLKDILKDKNAEKFWEKIFENTYRGTINTWDFQWVFSCWIQNSLAILPNVNLVKNIGFDGNATHTKGKNKQADLSVNSIHFPLNNPEFVIADNDADARTHLLLMQKKNIIHLIKEKMQNFQSR